MNSIIGILGLIFFGFGGIALLNKGSKLKKKTQNDGGFISKGILCIAMAIVCVWAGSLSSGHKTNHSNSSSSNENSNNSSSIHFNAKANDGSDTWIPEGYEKGAQCSDCDGTGHYTHTTSWVQEGAVCAGCNGRGYLLRQK